MSQEPSKRNKTASESGIVASSVVDEVAFRRLLRRFTIACITLSFFLLVALLLLLNVIFFSAERVDQTKAVLSELSRVEGLASEMDEDFRDFQIARDPAVLETFDHAKKAFPRELETLYVLLQNDKTESARLVDLRDAHRDWMDFANDALEKTKAHEPVSKQSQTNAKALMDHFRASVTAMEGYEESVLAARANFLTRVKTASLIGVILTGLVLVPLLVMYLRRTLSHLSTDYREALGCLDRERERAASVLESITDGYYSLDRDWRLTSVNRRAEELLAPFRKRHHNLIGKVLWEEFPDFVGTQFEKRLRHAMKTREVVDWEVFYAPINAWFTIRLFPSRDGLSIFFQEITERKTAAEKIRESEERLQLAVKAGQLGVWQLDLDEMNLTASPQCKANFGRSPDEPFSYGAMVAAIHPEDRVAVDSLVKRTIAEVGRYKVQYRCIWPDGTLHWISGQGHTLADERGRPVRLVGVTTEVTEQKLSEECERRVLENARALAEVNAKFRVFFEGYFLATVMTPNGTVIETSQHSLDAGGFRREEIVGTRFWDCGWWEPVADLQRMIRVGISQAATGKTFQQETECFCADGSHRFVDLTIAPIKDDAGKVLYLASSGIEKASELAHH